MTCKLQKNGLSCKKMHFPTEKCTFLQKCGFRGAHGRKLQEIAGGLQCSRIKNASQLSQDQVAKVSQESSALSETCLAPVHPPFCTRAHKVLHSLWPTDLSHPLLTTFGHVSSTLNCNGCSFLDGETCSANTVRTNIITI